MTGDYSAGDLVFVRFAAGRDEDGRLFPLRAGDVPPSEQWPWLLGEVVGECSVYAHSCTPEQADAAGHCPCREWTVDVLEEDLLWPDPDDEERLVYPVCFRTAEELMPRQAGVTASR